MHKTKKKFNGSVCALVFFTLAVIFVLYGAYMIFTVYQYLVSYYSEYGTTMQDQLSHTIQYFVSNCSPYFVYAVLCYGMGSIIQMLHGLKIHQNIEVLEDAQIEVNEAA